MSDSEQLAALAEILAKHTTFGVPSWVAVIRDIEAEGYVIVLAAAKTTPEPARDTLALARKEMQNRYDDLRSCNKDDDCHTKAEGTLLAIEDFDSVYGAALAAPGDEEVPR